MTAFAAVHPVSQDLSIAGKRKGLAGERSGMFLEQIRIIKEMRENHARIKRADEPVRPRWVIWENVKGCLSSPGKNRKGEDFRAVLTEFVRIVAEGAPDVPMPEKRSWKHAGVLYGVGDDGNPFSIAWRLHDAQYHGVPQRRARMCVLCDYGGYSAGEILFDLHDGRSAEDDYKDLLAGRAGTVEREAAEISAQREGVSGDSEPGETAREEAAGDAGKGTVMAISFQERGGCPGGGKGILNQNEQTGALSTVNNQYVSYGLEPGAAQRMNPESRVYEEICPTLRAEMGDNQASVEYCIQGNIVDRADTAKQNGVGWKEECAFALNEIDRPAVACDLYNQTVSDLAPTLTAAAGGTNTSGQKVLCAGFSFGQSAKAGSIGYEEEKSPCLRGGEGGNQKPCVMQVFDARGNGDGETVPTITGDHENRVTDYTALCVGNVQMCNMSMAPVANSLDCMHDQQAVLCYGMDRAAYNQGKNAKYDFAVDQEKIGAMTARGHGAVCQRTIVRRLIPDECASLTGFPRNWCNIGDWIDSKGKKHKDSDAVKYKAFGNSIALPFWQVLACGIQEQYDRPVEIASLFDGIGGFPLVFTRAGGRAVWASEIEEFPIAVTKKRFPEED